MCEFYEGDYEPCSVWSERERTARKDHRCEACGGRIRPGDRYTAHFSVADGRPHSSKFCAPCGEGRREFANEHGMIGTPDRFELELRECLDEEARAYWTDTDRRWRSILAGMLRRRRSASRGDSP